MRLQYMTICQALQICNKSLLRRTKVSKIILINRDDTHDQNKSYGYRNG